MLQLKRQFELLKSKVAKPKAEEPVLFQLTCSCGETHHGLRSASWKRVDCKICGSSLFVLPKDVYPVPRVRAEAAASPFAAVTERIAGLFGGKSVAAAQRVPVAPVIPEEVPDDVDAVTELGDDDAIEMFDEPKAGPRARATDDPPRRRRTRPDAQGDRVRKSSTGRTKLKRPRVVPPPEQVSVPDDEPERELSSLFEQAERRRSSVRLVTPVRLIALAMTLLVIGTTYWMWHRGQVSSAGQVFREGFANGQRLIDSREFSMAALELRKAEDAAAVLNRVDEDARLASQLLREVTAITQLADRDLVDWLQNGVGNGDADSVELAAQMVRLQNEKWFVFDALVSSGQNASAQVECPFLINGREVLIECPTDRLIDAGGSARCLFAAQVAEVSGVNDPSGPWRVRLDPESVTPITNEMICTELGLLDIDPRIADVMAAQAARLGIAESTDGIEEPQTGTGI